MNQIMITVEQVDLVNAGQYKVLYRNTVCVDKSLSFAYNKVYEVLRLLYPMENVSVVFRVTNSINQIKFYDYERNKSVC